MTCQTPNVHKMTQSYFRKNKPEIYVTANLVMKTDDVVINFNASNVISIYRDPNFKNLSSLQCFSSSKNQTLNIKGDHFSEFISSRVSVTTASQEKCQMKYVNGSFMECHTHVNKINNQNPDNKRDTSTETTTPEYVSGSHYGLGVLSGQTLSLTKPDRHKGKTTTPSLASTTKTPKPICPLTVQIGNLKVQLIEVKGTDPNHSWHIMFYLIPLAVIVVLVALVLALTLKLKNLKSMKEKQMYLHFTEANSGCGRDSCQTLKQILDSVAPGDDGKDMNTLIVDLDLLTVGKCIGSGNFGCVYEGLLTLDAGLPPQTVAIKALQDPFSNSIDLLGFLQEALIMKDFHHPHVMGLVGLAEKEPGVPYVILPFMDKGDLLTYVRDPAVSLTLHDVIKFCADIADGMDYLSSLKCVHRDLAARNCMLDTGNRVKVADFGLCRDIYEKGYYTSNNKKKLPIRWMALESIEHGAYSTKSDVWSLGVVLWELLTRGLTPYPGVDGWDVVNFLRRRRLPPPYFCPESLYNLMMVCWANDPIKRPTFGIIKSELLLLIGQNSSGVSFPGPSHDKTSIQQDDLVSVKGNASKHVKRGKGLHKGFDIQDTSAGVLNKKSALGKTTLNSRKVSREQVMKLRPSCADESEASRDVLPALTGDALDPRKTDGSETRCGLSIMSSMARPGVVSNFLITLPECFSDREVSKLAISLYENLVDNYEPPRKFTNPFLSLSRKFSKRSTEKWRQDIKMKYRIKTREDVSDDEESGGGSEDPRIGDDGAYHLLSPRSPERWSTISDDRNCSFRTYANVSSGDSLLTVLNTTTAGTPFCKDNDISGDCSTISPPRLHLPLSRQASQQ
ncbi:unnamed protein product [Lymnaea stagnalis]|uniref:Protein kinase domain-containing protein n=1 Tax=Lymnaea stagnalis TaxID=6523 RepID=A0AAV2H630_LYMST